MYRICRKFIRHDVSYLRTVLKMFDTMYRIGRKYRYYRYDKSISRQASIHSLWCIESAENSRYIRYDVSKRSTATLSSNHVEQILQLVCLFLGARVKREQKSPASKNTIARSELMTYKTTGQTSVELKDIGIYASPPSICHQIHTATLPLYWDRFTINQ